MGEEGYDWRRGYPWMNAAQVRGRLVHAHMLDQQHGVKVWLTLEAVAAARGVGVEPFEGFEIDETTIGPVVRVGPDPWSRAFYVTALLVPPEQLAPVDPKELKRSDSKPSRDDAD